MQFDLKIFSRTLLIFVLLSAAWTCICVTINWFEDEGRFTEIFGFIFILGSSLGLSQRKTDWKKWLILSVASVVIFLTATFVISGLLVLLTFNDLEEVSYAFVNSIFLAAVFTWLLKKMYGMEKIYMVMIATAVSVMVAYVIHYRDGKTPVDRNVGIAWQLNTFQVFLVVPLAAGLSLRKKKAPAAA